MTPPPTIRELLGTYKRDPGSLTAAQLSSVERLLRERQRAKDRKAGAEAVRRSLTKEDLAPLLKVHVRTVTRYASEGMPHDVGGHGKPHLYNLEECQKWVKDEGRGQKDAVAEDPTKAQVDLKFRREKARLAELERLEREGALHGTAECRHRHLRQLYVLKREFLALPRSAAPELEGHDRTETEAILRARITGILERFAADYTREPLTRQRRTR